MAATDTFSSNASGTTSPLEHLATVTTSDSVDLAFVTRALHVGGAGDIKVTTQGGETVTLTNVQVGVLPIRVTRIFATSTTATDIVAGW